MNPVTHLHVVIIYNLLIAIHVNKAVSVALSFFPLLHYFCWKIFTYVLTEKLPPRRIPTAANDVVLCELFLAAVWQCDRLIVAVITGGFFFSLPISRTQHHVV